MMAEGKRYYWLKLKDDFFSSKRIKKLRKLAGGDTYLIIYLKMQLKALKTDGLLKWTGLEENFADELALDLDEEPDNVKITLQYLASCGLIETSDSVNFLLPYVAENTGSETAATQRWRDWKARQDMLESNTLPTQSNALPTHNQHVANVEKEIEIEKEKELEIEKDIEPPKRQGGVFQRFAQGDKELASALKEFNEFRNRKKKPMTDEAKERMCRKLEKFPREQWIDILHQSIDQGWTDIYPLKGAENKETEKSAPLNRNFKVSGDPDKWAKDESFLQAIGDLMNGK